MKRKWFATLCAALVAAAPAAAVAADRFPARPIQVVIPFQPGDTDNMLRPFLERMPEFLGEQVILNYKPGAGGGIGAGFVAGSAPDGYTLVGTSPGSIVVVPLANQDVKYSPDNFEPVAALAEGGLMIVAPSNSRWKSIDELVKYSKSNPEKVTFTSSGALGITHLLAEALAHDAGVKWRHIPYKGSAPAITALLGGHVDMASTAIAPAQAHIQSGALRALAVFGDERLKAYPDVPTLKELGYNIGSPTYYGISAPAGTPPEVVRAIYDAAQKVSDKYGAQIAENLAVFGAQARLLDPADYKQYLAGQRALFSRAIEQLD
ncbi:MULTISPECIES: tripartite tricarboxylate transporter substrate binding protein [Bordetella]|uniref:tripartite tricarboxylate transporter substrate binding protein n=1 Tax=Bordetella TaxID=517 RepID=UPI00081D00F2|nr:MULTISPECIES: tripartite tricarboxylate transporter substrate binding protein [Bordetella]AOB25652.1 ABC transporter substrate-binding protein [Bordetella bronchiseptica]ARP78104.1 ABC transporter substrate-binding protein [Bordetella genomosp. 6]AZW42912.1 tripartite tricarboxylate transporter substrate binding protein [Bordetella bronchiseptica]